MCVYVYACIHAVIYMCVSVQSIFGQLVGPDLPINKVPFIRCKLNRSLSNCHLNWFLPAMDLSSLTNRPWKLQIISYEQPKIQVHDTG